MSILTEGDSSRLHRLLVEEKKLAIEVGGSFQEGFDPGPHLAAAHAARRREHRRSGKGARRGARAGRVRRASPMPS